MALTSDKAIIDDICLFVAGNPGCQKQDVVRGVKTQQVSIDSRIKDGWIDNLNDGVPGTRTKLYVTHKWLHYKRGGR